MKPGLSCLLLCLVLGGASAQAREPDGAGNPAGIRAGTAARPSHGPVGTGPEIGVESWRDTVAAGLADRLADKILRTRIYFDAVAWKSGADLWGDPRYWGSLPEVMARRAATPRDLTVAYYATLRAMGVPAEDLRIVIGLVPRLDRAARPIRRDYAVLLVHTDGQDLYVDPLSRTYIKTLPPNGFVGALAVNEDGEWLLANRSVAHTWRSASRDPVYLPAWVRAWETSRRLFAAG